MEKTKRQELEIGDLVCLVDCGGWGSYTRLSRGVVEAVTETQITAMGGRRFMKRSGKEVGMSNSWTSPTLQPLTRELIEEEAESIKQDEALVKCRAWAKSLNYARGKEAVRLAAMLPDLPEE